MSVSSCTACLIAMTLSGARLLPLSETVATLAVLPSASILLLRQANGTSPQKVVLKSHLELGWLVPPFAVAWMAWFLMTLHHAVYSFVHGPNSGRWLLPVWYLLLSLATFPMSWLFLRWALLFGCIPRRGWGLTAWVTCLLPLFVGGLASIRCMACLALFSGTLLASVVRKQRHSQSLEI
jgi:hypothetical protein